MLFYRSQRNLDEHKAGVTQLRRPGAAELIPRKFLHTHLESLRLFRDSALQRSRPIALNEIVTTVEHQEARIVQMPAHPPRRVKRGGQTVAGLNFLNEALLKGERGREPELAQQRIARSETVVERTLWRFQALGDGIDRDRGRPAFAGQRTRSRQKTDIVEQRPSHQF